MRLERIEARRSWIEAVIVRLFRRWVAARAEGRNTMVSLSVLGAELNAPLMLPVALDSLFQLTESCLGRALQAECCCSTECSPDERAILLLIALAPGAGTTASSAAVRHGLPGALVWAATSVRTIIADELGPTDLSENCPVCPFRQLA